MVLSVYQHPKRLYKHFEKSIESEEDELFRGRWGRPRLNLFNSLVNDLGKRNLSINTVDELHKIRDIAECKRCWSNLYGYRLQY